MCHHEIAHGQTHYDKDAHRLIHDLVCDDCHCVIRTVPGAAYEPKFVPSPAPKEV